MKRDAKFLRAGRLLRQVIYWPKDRDPSNSSEAELRRTVEELVKKGATAVQVNWEPHFRWDAHAAFDQLYAGLARLVATCHAAGLPVIEHHSSTCVSSRGALGATYRGVAFQDLVCRDLRTGAKGLFRISHDKTLYDCAWCCLNHPEWQALYLDHLRRYVLPSVFDGLQHDDIHFAPGWYYCGCEHCRAKFRGLFGTKLPSGDYAGWENFDDALWRDWLLFRKHSAGEEFARVRQVLGDDKLLSGCCSVGATSLIGQHDAGYSYEDFLRGANVIYREMVVHPRHRMVRGRHYFPNWRILATDFKYFEGLSMATGCPVINYSYAQAREEVWLAWALSRAMGQGNLWPFSATEMGLDQLGDFDAHQGSIVHDHQEPFGIALLYSDRTAALAGEDHQCAIDCFRGWCEVLLESGLPFFVLPVDLLEGTALKHLERAPLAIAPNLCCLGKKAAHALRQFVARGGRLIATHETSACDERGRRHPQLALANVFGIDAIKTTRQYGLPFFVEKALGGDVAGWVNRKLPHVLSHPNDPDRSRILGWVERCNSCSLKPPSPALIQHHYRKGLCLYFSGLIGVAAAEAGIRAVDGGGFDEESVAQSTSEQGAEWIDERDARCRQLMLRAIHSMAPAPWPIEVTRKPPGFFASIRKCADTFVVHFLNVGAGSINNGTRLLKEIHKFPAAAGKIEIQLHGVQIKGAQVLSGSRKPGRPTIIRDGETVKVRAALPEVSPGFCVQIHLK